MQDNNIYLYFGNNEMQQENLSQKTSTFFEDQFIDKSATGRYVFYLFRKPAYNSCK